MHVYEDIQLQSLWLFLYFFEKKNIISFLLQFLQCLVLILDGNLYIDAQSLLFYMFKAFD